MFGLDLLLASHLFVQASTGALSCPAAKNADIQVSWRTERVKYDFTRSIAQLEARTVSSANPYGVDTTTDVGGLMSGAIKVRSNIQVSTLTYPKQKRACLWVDTIKVEVVIDPTVFVASEFPRGTCKHGAILEHETQHVAIDRAVVQSYIEPIKSRMAHAATSVGVVGPKPEDALKTFQQKINAYVEAELKAVTDKMYKERISKQQAHDSRAEYDRVAAQCP